MVRRALFGIGLMLERDQVIGVFLHQRQPVDDKLVGLRAVQAEPGQRSSRSSAVPLPGTEAGRKIIFRFRYAFPV